MDSSTSADTFKKHNSSPSQVLFDMNVMTNPIRDQMDAMLSDKYKYYVKHGWGNGQMPSAVMRPKSARVEGSKSKVKQLITDPAFYDEFIVKIYFLEQIQNEMDTVENLGNMNLRKDSKKKKDSSDPITQEDNSVDKAKK